MRKSTKILLTIFSFCFIMVIFTISVLADDLDSVDLLLSGKIEIQKIESELKALDGNIEFIEIPEINCLRIVGDSEKVNPVISKFQNSIMSGQMAKSVLKCENEVDKNYEMSNILEGKDFFNSLSWYKNKLISDNESWDMFDGGGVKIGIIDSGIDTAHPVLSPMIDMESSKTFVSDSSSVRDENGHGTLVAGVLAQVSPNATITPYKVISSADGESLWTIQAMIAAVNDKQNIINMSLGTYKYDSIEDERLTIEAFKRAILYAKEHNVIIVASAGNNGLDLDESYDREHLLHLPSDIPDVISVSAINFDNTLTSYSNFGSGVDCTAPGGEYIVKDGYLDIQQLIFSTFPTYFDNNLSAIGISQGYAFSYGTSLSAPMISGVIADYLSKYYLNYGYYPSIDNIEESLSYSSIDLGVIGKDKYFGYGLPDLAKLKIYIEGEKNDEFAK